MELETTIKLDDILGGAVLTDELSDNDLIAIGDKVVQGYRLDKQSREGWEGKIDEWTNLALQVTEHKTTPWPGAANVKYPLIATAALQFSARAYPALLPGTNPVRGRVIGYDTTGEKAERAVRIGKHISYQVLCEMEDWEEEMDRLLFSLPIVGTMFKKTYFDAVEGRNRSEVVWPKELVVNYWAKNLEDADRVTHELRMSKNDVYERVAAGTYRDIDLDEITPNPNPNETKRSSDRAAALEQPEESDTTTPYTILEQCVSLDLDDDGYDEPYIVTVEEGTSEVLRIVPRFMDEDVLRSPNGRLLRIKPINLYTKYSFIPSPDGGFYDIGFGILLGPINNTINTLINQLLDAGTLSNMQSGLISKGIRIKGGNTSFTPGEWKMANSIGDDLRKGFVPLPVREPSQVLFSLLGTMIESGEKLSSVTEMMTGDIPGQNTKATVAMAAIEQGMKVFSSIYKRIHRSQSKEYKKLATLNSIFLPEQAYFNILDPGMEGAEEIKRTDYNLSDVDVIPTSDPNVATEEQRLAKIEALGELAAQGLVNPQEYAKRFVEATEQPNIDALLEMPEQGPSPEQEALEFEKMKWEEENARAWDELDYKRKQGEAAALKSLADAEAAEPGNQLGQYAQVMDMMSKDDLSYQKLQQLQDAHEQKLQQQEQMHQQKLAQQAQQQEAVNGGAGQQGDTGGNSGAV